MLGHAINRLLEPRVSIGVIFGVCLLSLGFALVTQYAFDVQPCILCLWQRVPYALALLVSFYGLLPKTPQVKMPWVLGLCAIFFGVNAGAAFFHTGVELHWWLGTSGCAVQPLHPTTAEDLRSQLLHTVVARCDQISWKFLGLSMANWNVFLSSGLACYSITAALRATARR